MSGSGLDPNVLYTIQSSSQSNSTRKFMLVTSKSTSAVTTFLFFVCTFRCVEDTVIFPCKERSFCTEIEQIHYKSFLKWWYPCESGRGHVRKDVKKMESVSKQVLTRKCRSVDIQYSYVVMTLL